MPFPFENLEVYKRSIELYSYVEAVLNRPGIGRTITDQFSRAALSIPLNIAEGNGRWHKAEKRNFFWIARGSAFECIPILEILKGRNMINERELKAFREKLDAIGRMLTKLIEVHSTDKDSKR